MKTENTNDKNIYFAFSKEAAQRYGYHVVTFTDGTTLNYTSVADNQEYFDRTYIFQDKILLGSKLSSDVVSFHHVEKITDELGQSHAVKTDPYTIVEKIKHLRDSKDEEAHSKNNFKV